MRTQRRLLLAAVLLLAAPGATFAQIRTLPGVNTGMPIAQTQAVLNNANTVGQARFLANPNRFAGNNWGGAAGYSPWGYAPYMGDYSLGNTLQGAASVINAQGQFNIQNQQAKVTQQQAAQAKLDTRRQTFDQMRYEQENTPTPNDLREKAQQEELRRIRNGPQPAEIWSGAALNTLLKTVQREQAALGGITGPPIPLSPDLVQQLNMSGGTAIAGVGVLKGDRLEWPLGLQDSAFNGDRKKIDDLATQLVKQATMGRVDGQTLIKFNTAAATLRTNIKGQIDALSPGDYVKSIRFANELAATGRSLEDPAAVNFFNGRWTAQAATVPELIAQMTTKGLTFAPAASGQETAYTAVFQAINDYDVALGQMTARLQSAGR